MHYIPSIGFCLCVHFLTLNPHSFTSQQQKHKSKTRKKAKMCVWCPLFLIGGDEGSGGGIRASGLTYHSRKKTGTSTSIFLIGLLQIPNVKGLKGFLSLVMEQIILETFNIWHYIKWRNCFLAFLLFLLRSLKKVGHVCVYYEKNLNAKTSYSVELILPNKAKKKNYNHCCITPFQLNVSNGWNGKLRL